jgi:signal recognition particle GTPase
MANYIIFAMTKEEKKEKKIITENRMVTVNRR